MPHSAKLTQRIKVLVEADYPDLQFDYTYDQTLPHHSGFRPDILVWKGGTNDLVCVVEIGYTRPEKLAFYISLGLDARWYSKEGELCSGVAMNASPPTNFNCTVKVHPNQKSWKPELYAPFEMLSKLKVTESDRYITVWDEDFQEASLIPSILGRMWARRKSVAGGPLVGQARLRLKPPGNAIPFKPGERSDVWLGLVNGVITLRFSRPFAKATEKAVKALVKKRRLSP